MKTKFDSEKFPHIAFFLDYDYVVGTDLSCGGCPKIVECGEIECGCPHAETVYFLKAPRDLDAGIWGHTLGDCFNSLNALEKYVKANFELLKKEAEIEED